MSKDPRRRDNGDKSMSPPVKMPEVKQSILFGDADDEDVMDVDEAIPASTIAATIANSSASNLSLSGTGSGIGTNLSNELISRIIIPSPYPHHNAGPTSSRFRNSLQRVTSSPKSDVEAWQALMTEVTLCYKNITNIHSVDGETYPKLDWIESCYGTLLKNFPYAQTHYVTIIEMLLAQSARFGEENGPSERLDYSGGMDTVSRRSLQCEAKLEALLRFTLGVEMDGSLVDDNIRNGICVWVVELWLLFIRKVERDAKRHASSLPPDTREKYVRDATTKAYEAAIAQAGFSHNNHQIWRKYIDYVKSWLQPNQKDHALAQQQMVHLRSVYQRLVQNPMTGLDQLWQEYELFERGQSEALAQALISEYSPKYQNARTCYLERNRVYNSIDLQLGRLATPPVEETEEDHALKIEEEYHLLKLWKTRCSYERINPLRLDPPELAKRIRHAFKEMACVFTRHPESWHMWSTWEVNGIESRKVDRAVTVLQLGQEHIPDCTILAYAEAQIIEMYTEMKNDCVKPMEKFLDRSPNTLGFVLYQQMVRRYKGKDEARLVFSKARRVLANYVKNFKKDVDEKKKLEGKSDETELDLNDKVQTTNKNDDNLKIQMVTNRLDPSIGNESAENGTTEENGNADVGTAESNPSATSKVLPGPVTWHLYAAHAVMEHRHNHCPEVAARVYELGLRKHATFITIPPYVLRYAQLLLELNDTRNLRALLTRAVAACEANENKASLAALWDMSLYFESVAGGSDPAGVNAIQAIERRRWEALLGPEIEDVANGGFVGVEEAALIGAQKSTLSEQLIRSEGYDVSSRIVNGLSRTVDFMGVMGFWGDADVNSAKSRIRAKHNVDPSKDSDEFISGGQSDATYQKRLNYQYLAHSGLAQESNLGEGAVGLAASKALSARERLQHGPGGTGLGPGQGTAIMLAIQQSPEFLRPLLLLLPASRLRLPVVAKPPPHLTEMALSQLRQNTLPSERPEDDGGNDSKKRTLTGSGGDNGGGGGNNSSDEDNNEDDDANGGGSGYSSAFRARQRARMMQKQESN